MDETLRTTECVFLGASMPLFLISRPHEIRWPFSVGSSFFSRLKESDSDIARDRGMAELPRKNRGLESSVLAESKFCWELVN